jgi:hypothetical protein
VAGSLFSLSRRLKLFSNIVLLRRLCAFVVIIACFSISVSCTETNVDEYKATDQRLGTQVGKKDGANIVTTGVAGFLVYGPYIKLMPGRFRLDVEGSLKGSEKPIATIDVIGFKGDKIFAIRPIYGDESRTGESLGKSVLGSILIEIPTETSDIEFRIQVPASTSGYVSNYKLIKLSDIK